MNVKVKWPLRKPKLCIQTLVNLPVLDDKLEDLKATKKKIVSVSFFTAHIQSHTSNNEFKKNYLVTQEIGVFFRHTPLFSE